MSNDKNGSDAHLQPEKTSQLRKWEPNRKKRKPKSKKSFDQKKIEDLAAAEKRIYKGELDNRRRDPNRQPSSISYSEKKVRAKAAKLAENNSIITAMLTEKITDFRAQFKPCKASPSRLGALYATRQVRVRNAFAQEIIKNSIDSSKLSQRDRAFATLLTLGVVSTSGALDEIINRSLSSPNDIKPDVRDALRISTYEIIYLRKTPHAAVDQGVELVRAIVPSASGLGNAVLHRILKSADVFPFGDPTKDINALALAYAFPSWLAHLLIKDIGSKDASMFMSVSNDPAPLFIHVNAIKATEEEVRVLFEEVGATLELVDIDGIVPKGCFRVSDSRVLSDGRITHLFQQGKVLVSDAAAQAIASFVAECNECDGEVLEIGAGRGTKTIMIQSDAFRIYGKQFSLVSLDNHLFKSDLLEKRASDYGVELKDVITGNAMRLNTILANRLFDTIFIDAPCSGLGTLRRHHEIRWRLQSERIEEMAFTGFELLKSAACHVKPGGQIIYSTCTITYAENYSVVKRFLECEEGSIFKLAPINNKACFSSLLSKDSPDAHFAARFVRNTEQNDQML